RVIVLVNLAQMTCLRRLASRLLTPTPCAYALSFLCLLCFFFSSSGARRDLHSFPTRRSSDLIARWRSPRSAPPASHAPSPAKGRSEEHTSELQSHLNLVCRLLLEKKKKRHRSNPTDRTCSRR